MKQEMIDYLRKALEQSEQLVQQARKLKHDYPIFAREFDNYMNEQHDFQRGINDTIVELISPKRLDE